MIQAVSLLVIGLGVGWLSGLSVSPVIGTVLASLVGIAAGIVTGRKSLSSKEGSSGTARKLAVDARPAAVLVFGVAVGATLGILARNYEILEPRSSILARTHQILAPLATSAAASETSGTDPAETARLGVLFGATQDECSSLRAHIRSGNEDAFRAVLYASGEWGQELDKNVADTEALKRIVLDLCESDHTAD